MGDNILRRILKAIIYNTSGEELPFDTGGLSVKLFLLEVAKGNVPGHRIERKFGSIDAVQAATPADVWEYGTTVGAELYTFSPDGVADIDTMSSSNAGDTEDITIDGLDSTGTRVIQTKAANGQNQVSLDTALWRVNRAYNSNGTDLLGNFYIYVNGAAPGGVPSTVTDVRGFISIGEGQTLQSIYTVPLGETAYFVGLETSLTKGTGATAVSANLRGRTREFGKVFRTQDEFNLLSSGTSRDSNPLPAPLPFQARTDFCPIVDVSANGVGVSWAYTMILVEDGF